MNDYYVIDGTQADAVDAGMNLFTGLGQALVGMLMTIVIISLVLGIVQIVATAMVYKKAGESWWKCLIPFYGQYIFYKIVWDPLWFWVSLGLGLVSCMASSMIGGVTVLSVVCAVIMAFYVALEIMTNIKFAKSFGRSGAFAIGLILFNPIFLLIIAFSKNQYVGPGGQNPVRTN